MSEENELNELEEVNVVASRYYYKSKDGKGFLNLKAPLSSAEEVNYIAISQEEFERLTYVEPYSPTEEQIQIQTKRARIAELKSKLRETDYVALKLAEGETTKEEYADVFANRVAWRAEINQIEEELSSN